jgi:hypothetical protein
MAEQQIQKWSDWSSEEAKREADEAAAMDGGEFLSMKKEGEYTLRFLPPALGEKSPFLMAAQHFVTLPAQDKVSFNCPQEMAGSECPLCRRIEKLKGTGNGADWKAAKKLFPRRRVYARVIDMNHPEKGQQIYAFGKTVHDGLLAIKNNPKLGGDFVHPLKGREIIIARKGTGQFDTEYTVNPSLEQTPLADMSWIDRMVPNEMARFGIVLDVAEIEAKLRGEDGNRGAGGRTAQSSMDEVAD